MDKMKKEAQQAKRRRLNLCEEAFPNIESLVAVHRRAEIEKRYAPLLAALLSMKKFIEAAGLKTQIEKERIIRPSLARRAQGPSARAKNLCQLPQHAAAWRLKNSPERRSTRWWRQRTMQLLPVSRMR